MGLDSIEVEFLGTMCHADLWEDKEYLNFISSIWAKQLKDTERRTGEVDSLKISLLAGLEIVDKLVKNRNQGEGEIQDPNSKVCDLIGELDSVLIDE